MPSARTLRKNQTTPETILWYRLRNRRLKGYKFRRQHPLGAYVVDFVCLEKYLVVEIDGGQHDVQRAYDAQRTQRLMDMGFRVIRFWNNDVMGHTDAVLEVIWMELEKKHPSP